MICLSDVKKAIAELRKEGLWSACRLPKVVEPSRKKTHWDYVLEEMHWLATDFVNERRWKINAAKNRDTSLQPNLNRQASPLIKDKAKKNSSSKKMKGDNQSHF